MTQASGIAIDGPEDLAPIAPSGVVGIGGSAGGVEALLRLVGSLAPDAGVAYVVVLHLSPPHDSNLAALLQSRTSMLVTQVTNSTKIARDTIYVIPPSASLAISDSTLVLTERAAQPRRRHSIDLLFRTLARSFGARTVGVVLSGTGNDGAAGLREVKRARGTTVVQKPSEAEFDDMPLHAIATGDVDWILPLDQMARRLRTVTRASSSRWTWTIEDAKPLPDLERLPELLSLIQAKTQHDLTMYKEPSLVRRLGRSLRRQGLESLGEYITFLSAHPGDASRLLKDLLINVTGFFRDPEAYACFAQDVVPRLFADAANNEPIRVWSAGCASGEEPYSIGMLLLEYAATLADPPKIQIFATDVDEDALREAREHRYPLAIEVQVSEDRLRRFFVREGDVYRVRRELRDIVLFAPHDVLRDPPFSRLDLVVCRNVLIYFTPASQQFVLRVLHFALRDDGTLFLGSAESAESARDSFSEIDKRAGLFRKLMTVGRPTIPALTLSRVADVRVPSVPDRTRHVAAAPFAELHLRLLERVSPPSIVVNADLEIVHLSESAGRFLRFHGGEPTRELYRTVHPDLVPELRAAVYTAQREGQPPAGRRVVASINGSEVALRLTVRQLPGLDAGRAYYLIVFDELGDSPSEREATPPVERRTDEILEDVVRRLEDELRRTKERLRVTSQEHEVSEQELKASNEELQVSIEELRSASEEVEVNTEELRSVNEELTIVNGEMKVSLDDVARANADLQNLVSSTDIATIFLDRNLRIKRYTPQVPGLFHLIPSDIGRTLAHVTHDLDYPELLSDATRVASGMTSPRREVESSSGAAYLVHMAPYRSAESSSDGLVINLIDITERRRAEQSARWLSAVVSSSSDAIVSATLDRRILSWNQGAERLFGYVAAEVVGESLQRLSANGEQEPSEPAMEHVQRGQPLTNREVEWRRRNGSSLTVSVSYSPIRDGRDGIVGMTLVAKDITLERQHAHAIRESEGRLRRATEIETVGMVFFTLDGRVLQANAAFTRMSGWKDDEVSEIGRSGESDIRMPGWTRVLEHVSIDGHAKPMELEWRRPSGDTWWSLVTATRLSPAEGVAFVVDISDRKSAEASLQETSRRKDEFLAILAHELRNPLAPIRNALEIFSLSGGTGQAAETAARIMDRQVSQLVHLVDDLLDLSRINHGRIELRVEPTNLVEIVQDAIDAAELVFERAHVRLSAQLSESTLVVNGDRSRLTQMVGNLLSNACKFSNAGDVVEVELMRDDASAVIRVRDQGIGIDSTDLEHIFEMFVQADKSSGRMTAGLGIGLTIVRQLAELHQGTVAARSAGRGHGAEFVISLPVDERTLE
ncbi:MAG: CheR family methyltransferase [Gemmatimonadota bacterium]